LWGFIILLFIFSEARPQHAGVAAIVKGFSQVRVSPGICGQKYINRGDRKVRRGSNFN
jgi:hypothetical protein